MSANRAKQLVDAGQFRDAAGWLDAKTELSQADRVLRAQVELECGDVELSRTHAEALLREHLDSRSKASCISLTGRAMGRLGASMEGLNRMQKAVGLAAETDCYLEAELLAHFVSALLNWIGIEPALAELPRLRKTALTAGNTQALVEYHIVHARVSAMRGWLQRAEQEARIASDLLQTSPHLLQLWKVRQLQSNAAIKACELASARALAQECLTLATSSGSRQALGTTFGNLAHISVMTGEYDEGRRFLDRALAELDSTSYMRIAAFSTGIELGLSSLDDDVAQTMVSHGESLNRGPSEDQPYYHLFFELNRVRWLIYRERYEDAAHSATAALKIIEKLADSDLLDRMKLLAAEAHARAGAEDTSMRLFAEVCGSVNDQSLETFAETNRVAAVLTSRSDPVSARDYLSRAWRVLTAAGLMGRRSGVERTSNQLGISIVDTGQALDREVAATAIQAFASALHVGGHPRVLGTEILSLLKLLGVQETASLSSQAEEASGPNLGAESNNTNLYTSIPLNLEVGTADRCVLRINAIPKLSANSYMLWRSVDQIIRSANATANGGANDQEIRLWPIEASPHQLGMVVAADDMVELVNTSRRLAPSNITILLTGETGTGKELLARALHEASPRKPNPFIPFNCSAVARDMLDAQLFGYRRGAFTGAHEAFQGVIRAAIGGTLFLDEIGEMPLDVQPKLLRFLESGEIHPLGEPKPISVDVRVVAATNANLEQLVAEGRFREDLFYRLNVVRLQVPPLRERREEIPPLVQHYLERCTRESRKTGLRFAEETMEYLVLYRWPGNVRQLANEIRRLVALAEPGAVLMPEHLSHDIRASRRTIPATERMLAPTEFVVRLDQPLSAAWEHLERTMVQHALKGAGGRLEEAAQLLGLSRKGLYLKRQRLRIAEGASAGPELAATASAQSE